MITLISSRETLVNPPDLQDHIRKYSDSGEEFLVILSEDSSEVLDTLFNKDLSREIKEYIKWSVDFFVDKLNDFTEIMSFKIPIALTEFAKSLYIRYRATHILITPKNIDREDFARVIDALKFSLLKKHEKILNYLIEEVINQYNKYVSLVDELIDDIENRIWEEENILLRGREATKIYSLKRSLIEMERSLLRLRDLLTLLEREEFFKGSVDYEELQYSRVEITSLIENISVLRDLVITLIDIDIALASYKINDVMKKLTAITLILMPPTLIASIYGMNFDTSVSPWNMPELKLPFGYPMALAMIFLAMWLPYVVLKRLRFL
ncbi:MAG: magnesium transporter CorA family protein [Sulfolobales archaeon]